MYNAFIEIIKGNEGISAVFMVLVLSVSAYCLVKKMQDMGLEAVRGEAYQAILKAEHQFKKGDNYRKFNFAVSIVRSRIPSPFKYLITETLLREAFQLWFDLVKDLLDDGKLNNSEKE